MKLLKTRLKGFIGIKKGLGLEEIEVDLSGLNGLIALQGENGRGKTTFLENLHPFRTLPSRKFTLKTHCYLKDSEKELSFEFNGDHYRTLVKMNALTTTRDEGFIWKNDEPMVDGLVRNFDNYLDNLMGSQSLFFASIFCAQNSAKLSDMRPAELKSLYAEFLQLDRYVTWENTSKAIINLYQSRVLDTESRIRRVETRMKMLGDPRADLQAGLKVAAGLEIDLVDLDMQIEAKTERLEELRKIAVDSLVNQEKKIALERDREAHLESRRKFCQDHDNKTTQFLLKSSVLEDEARETEKTVEHKAEIEKAVTVVVDASNEIDKLEEHIYVLNYDIKESNSLLTNERERAAKVKQKITELNVDTWSKDLTNELNAVNREIEILDTKIKNKNLDPELVKIEAIIEAQEKSAAVLKDIDPACTSEVCGLITQSLSDKAELPATRAKYDEAKGLLLDMYGKQSIELNRKLADLKKQAEAQAKEIGLKRSEYDKSWKKIEDSIAVVEHHNTELGKKLEKANTERSGHHDARVNAKELADRAPGLEIAEARLKDLNSTMNDIKTEMAAMVLSDLNNTQEFSAKMDVVKAKIVDVSKLIDLDADALHQKVDFELEALDAKKKELSEKNIKMAATVDACKKEVDQLSMMESENRESQNHKTSYLTHQSRWIYIRDACSKDGLRALEIEGVAPVITGYANDMLTGTFGPNHTVRFETQDEDGKEILDIVVISGDGSETLLSNLSGGERVWILKSLRLAQTLISQQKSGRHFDTALMDEEDGALSNRNAIRFISLYGTLMEMAKMDACYFISHRADAISMADHRIEFKEGGISVL
jgi:exonuclease SbcC